MLVQKVSIHLKRKSKKRPALITFFSYDLYQIFKISTNLKYIIILVLINFALSSLFKLCIENHQISTLKPKQYNKYGVDRDSLY